MGETVVGPVGLPQVTGALEPSVTVQFIDPAGAKPGTPVTVAVRVVVWPRVGFEDATTVTVGTFAETPRVTELELLEM